MRRGVLWSSLGLCFLFGAIGVFFSGTGTAGDIHPHFQQAWERTDRPVASGDANRTWMWGPAGHTDAFYEPYDDAPEGERLVQYFDKTRMEITDPDGDPDDLWHVTNGLLARELITGEMQVGDTSFDIRKPADQQIAGDTHAESPTYATFESLLHADSTATGELITLTVNGSGMVGVDNDLTRYGVTAEHYVDDTGHAVASVFWEFMHSSGTVRIDGENRHGDLFENPFFGVGLPITGAYWVHVPVAGDWQDVLVQCFERRCLTYTPNNPDNWRVEAGNIGQHYYEWRYETAADDPGGDDSQSPVPADDELGPPVPDACEASAQARFTGISDSLGNSNPNSWGQGSGGDWPGGIDASPSVSVGQELSLTISATGDCDPLEYRIQRFRPDHEIAIIQDWTQSSEVNYTFEDDDAGDYLMLIVDVRNQDPRNHFDDRDDYTYLTYVVE